MTITAEQVKELRERTGAGMMECKKALAEAAGDIEKAIERAAQGRHRRGGEGAAGRAANEGLVEAYIHPGNRVGVLIEVNCETDFVARTDEFAELVRNLAMQVAALGARVRAARGRARRARGARAGDLRRAGRGARASRRPSSRRSWRASSTSSTPRCACSSSRTSATTRTRSATWCWKPSRKMGENIVVRRFARFRLGQE